MQLWEHWEERLGKERGPGKTSGNLEVWWNSAVCVVAGEVNVNWVCWKVCIFCLDPISRIKIKECVLNEEFFFLRKLEGIFAEPLQHGMQFLLLEVSTHLMVPLSHFQLELCSFSKDSVLFFTLYLSSWMLPYAGMRKLDGHSLFEERCVFWPCHAAFGILVPWQGIEHMPPAVKKYRVLTTGLPGKSLTPINHEVLTDGPMEK